MTGSNTFCFKHFTVNQEGCAMKVGTDGVLLGAWCRIEPAQDKAILDIGTGTGVIALQLAQRTIETDTRIEAVEIDPAACYATKRNFETSEWADRLMLHSMPVQEFAQSTPNRYDHIVSNPPWFMDSLSSSDASRTISRHTKSLSYDDLMKCCFKLLTASGRVSLIVSAGAATKKMIAVANIYGFEVSRRTDVHSTLQSGPKRTLLEFSRYAVAAKNTLGSTSLIIQDNGPGTFSPEYRTLTRDFYLYF